MKIENVLDDNIGFIELVDSMGSDKTIVNAARTSFGKEKEELDARDIKLIKYLAKNSHMSPFRHIQLQFKIKAPELVARQFFRHLIGMEYSVGQKDTPWNEVSGRYLVMDDEFYVPKTFRAQSKDNKQASKGEIEDQDKAWTIYQTALQHAYNGYRDLINMGVAKEQARGLLPVSFYTQWVVTMSLQAVTNFIQLRDHDHAQFEIKEYAKAMKKLALTVAPEGLSALVENMK